MAKRYQHDSRPKMLTFIGLTVVVFGAIHVAIAAVFIPNPDLAINYQDPILEDLGDVPHEELVADAIAAEIISAVAGAIGIVLGFGILRKIKWAWAYTVVYNIIFVLLSAAAFATNNALPDSYLAFVSLVLLILLFKRTTRSYFDRLKTLRY